VGQRGEDHPRLLGDVLPPSRGQCVQGSHVVQPVAQLDHDHSDVAGHGEEHLAQVSGLVFRGRVEVESAQLRDPVHEPSDGRVEQVTYLIDGDGGVLDRIV